MNTEVPETPPLATIMDAYIKQRADKKARHPIDVQFVAMLKATGLKDPEDFRYTDGKCRIKREGMTKMVAGVLALEAKTDEQV